MLSPDIASLQSALHGFGWATEVPVSLCDMTSHCPLLSPDFLRWPQPVWPQCRAVQLMHDWTTLTRVGSGLADLRAKIWADTGMALTVPMGPNLSSFTPQISE